MKHGHPRESFPEDTTDMLSIVEFLNTVKNETSHNYYVNYT